jgi:TRAP-type C4-dicarboxylate transport system permease small subunit
MERELSQMTFWKKLDQWLVKLTSLASGIAIIIMMAVIVGNVLGRAFFSRPLYGMVEVVSLSGVLFLSLAIGYTERCRTHIAIVILTSKLPQWLRSIFAIASLSLSLCMVALLAWGGFSMGIEDATTPGATTYVFQLNKAPFRFTWVAGCLLLFGYLLHHLIEAVDQVRRK